MKSDQQLLNTYYILASLSLLSSFCVSTSIARMGLHTSPTKLVFYLHLTLVLENVTTLPDVFIGNAGLCSFAGFIRTYAGLANSIVVSLLVLLYRYWFVKDTYNIMRIVSKYREMIVFGFPLLITLLPFTTGSYQIVNQHWCTLNNTGSSENLFWAVFIYCILVSVSVLGSFILMLETIARVFISDPRYASSLLRSVGLYVFVSIWTWIPRAVTQVGAANPENTYFLTYIAGIIYFFIYLFEKESFRRYEGNRALNSFRDSDQEAISFSWDADDFSLSMNSESSLTSVLHKPPIQESYLNSVVSPSASKSSLGKLQQASSVRMGVLDSFSQNASRNNIDIGLSSNRSSVQGSGTESVRNSTISIRRSETAVLSSVIKEEKEQEQV